VHGGYKQDDVNALARILTGWGVCSGSEKAIGHPSGFCFDGKRHDYSDKILLGKAIRGRGVAEVEEALDLLANHPSTAKHISFKLAQYFVADDPPSSLVDRLSKRFIDTQGDIRAVLRALFQSSEFWDERYFNAKFKTPYRYVLSIVRVNNTHIENVNPLLNWLAQMNMPLYGCLTPDGYKNTQEAWLSSDAMLRRISFATAMAAGHLPLTERTSGIKELDGAIRSDFKPVHAPKALEARLLEQRLKGILTPKTLDILQTVPESLKAGTILASPEFMKY
jgi:uncharacterized protein (DUF1800 family)